MIIGAIFLTALIVLISLLIGYGLGIRNRNE